METVSSSSSSSSSSSVLTPDGRAVATGEITVSSDVGRAVVAALVGLTPHPWPGVEHGEGRAPRTLEEALEGVPVDPATILAVRAAQEVAAQEEELSSYRMDLANACAKAQRLDDEYDTIRDSTGEDSGPEEDARREMVASRREERDARENLDRMIRSVAERAAFDRPNVTMTDDGAYHWRPWNGGDDREVTVRFHGDDATISWWSVRHLLSPPDNDGWGTQRRIGTEQHQSRFIGRIVAWALAAK